MLSGHTGVLLTARLGGSFGILEYALLAVTASWDATTDKSGSDPRYSMTEDLLRRGFRRACNGDYSDIALKAQPADGTIVCRVSASNVSLVVDDGLVWTQRLDPVDNDHVRWAEAARTKAVTLISGDHLLISGPRVDTTTAAQQRTLVMAKIPANWI